MTDLLGYLSDFGDENMLWPIMALVLMTLIAQRRLAMSGIWIGLTVATFGAMLALKLGFEACGRAAGHAVYSPSGHTAGSTFVYGGLVIIFGRQVWIGLLTACTIALLIGFSRVWVGAHDPAEVVVGGCAGLFGAFGLAIARHFEIAKHGNIRPSRGILIALGLGAILITVMLHGVRSPVEHQIEALSHRILGQTSHCPRPVN